jgi:hypothetical protein
MTAGASETALAAHSSPTSDIIRIRYWRSIAGRRRHLRWPMSPNAIARSALILCLMPFLAAQAPAPRNRTPSSGSPTAPAASYSGNEMSYRGFSST